MIGLRQEKKALLTRSGGAREKFFQVLPLAVFASRRLFLLDAKPDIRKIDPSAELLRGSDRCDIWANAEFICVGANSVPAEHASSLALQADGYCSENRDLP